MFGHGVLHLIPDGKKGGGRNVEASPDLIFGSRGRRQDCLGTEFSKQGQKCRHMDRDNCERCLLPRNAGSCLTAWPVRARRALSRYVQARSPNYTKKLAVFACDALACSATTGRLHASKTRLDTVNTCFDTFIYLNLDHGLFSPCVAPKTGSNSASALHTNTISPSPTF